VDVLAAQPHSLAASQPGPTTKQTRVLLELVVMAELGVPIESRKAMPLSTGPEVRLGRGHRAGSTKGGD
jgi:hypothetical protein